MWARQCLSLQLYSNPWLCTVCGHEIENSCLTLINVIVQHECIPQAVLGIDILCQAKSGMGKTAVFVLASLQQLEPVDGVVSVLVMCHTRELAFQISKEYERFSKYMPTVKVQYSIYNIGQFCLNNCIGHCLGWFVTACVRNLITFFQL